MEPLTAVGRPTAIKRPQNPFHHIPNPQASPLVPFFFQRPQLQQKAEALLALDPDQVRMRTSPAGA